MREREKKREMLSYNIFNFFLHLLDIVFPHWRDIPNNLKSYDRYWWSYFTTSSETIEDRFTSFPFFSCCIVFGVMLRYCDLITIR